MSGAEVKEIMLSFGADLCGIASIDRFDDAPRDITHWMYCLLASR